ncbi:hypothetical protein B0H14DRAFT_3752927 [Mycena olivaceomarginata]|nr:hypothetical protein B0H14DRAFT_3752927 [Mycena olivaceomarginata]
MKTPFLGAIINTTQAVLKTMQTVSKHKDDCVQLLEQIHKLLNAIMILHIKSDAGGEMPIEVLDPVGKFTEYCPRPLEIHYTLTTGISILHKIYTFVEAHQKGNRISRQYSWSANSSSSLSMLPAEPKIFHGHESELSDILHLSNTGIPRIAILGTGGMGKTSLARVVLHHQDITARYAQNRFFVAYNSATTKVELENLIGSHLGLKPGKDLTQAVLQHFSNNPPSLLILDELENLWEPANSRGDTEELLSLLTSAEDLALVEEVDHILSLTDNMPLAISLLAHLADTEGCSNVLSCWNKEKTPVISEGFDKRSNLDLSIFLSLSSPRIQLLPHSQEFLSLLSMLPAGLTDADLIQSKLPLENILKCKATLKSTALAYSDEHKRLKVLMPIRGYLQQHQPPGDHLLQSLFKYFQEMLKFYMDYIGTQSISSTIARIKSNLTNIQNVLQWGLKQKQPTLSNSIYCVCHLYQFHEVNMQVQTPLMDQIQDLLPRLNDHQIEAYFLIESIHLWKYYPISDPEALASQVEELFKDFDDPDLKCRFYFNMASYYQAVKNNLGGAANMCKKLISLATQTGNIRAHSQGSGLLAWISIQLGTYSVAQMDARESQKLSRISGDLFGEANAVCTEAICWKELGHYKKSLSLSIRAQSLLSLCDQHAYWHAFALLNVAEIEVFIYLFIKLGYINGSYIRHRSLNTLSSASLGSLGAPWTAHCDTFGIHCVQWSIFTTLNIKPWIICCDATLADMYIRERDLPAAKRLFKRCLKLATEHSEIKLFCFERLGNASSWGADESTPVWTTIFLIHSLKCKQPLKVYKALQFFGDTFLHQKDEDTAITLFTVALEGFTYMDVHHSRAECMVRLGDISNRCGDLLKAVEFWNTARPLFERSSQAKEVQHIDKRLASIDNNVLEQQRESIAGLVRLNVHSGSLH